MGHVIVECLMTLGLFCFFDWYFPIFLRERFFGQPLSDSDPQAGKKRYIRYRHTRILIAVIFTAIDSLLLVFAGEDYFAAFLILTTLLYALLVIYYIWCSERNSTPWA